MKFKQSNREQNTMKQVRKVTNSGEKLFLTVKILSVMGIALALFLLWEQFFHPTFQPCRINSFVNCDAIISGAVAKTMSIPTPLYGLVGYIVILIAAMQRRKNLVLGMTTFGLLFCLWIAFQELVLLHVVCPICIACQIIMITVFTLAIVLKKRD